MERFTRDELLCVLGYMGVDIPSNSKLSDQTLDKRLHDALNAAQYITSLSLPLDFTRLPTWSDDRPLHKSVQRSNMAEKAVIFAYGAKAMNTFVDPFMDMRQTAMSMGSHLDNGHRCCIVQDLKCAEQLISIRVRRAHFSAPAHVHFASGRFCVGTGSADPIDRPPIPRLHASGFPGKDLVDQGEGGRGRASFPRPDPRDAARTEAFHQVAQDERRARAAGLQGDSYTYRGALRTLGATPHRPAGVQRRCAPEQQLRLCCMREEGWKPVFAVPIRILLWTWYAASSFNPVCVLIEVLSMSARRLAQPQSIVPLAQRRAMVYEHSPALRPRIADKRQHAHLEPQPAQRADNGLRSRAEQDHPRRVEAAAERLGRQAFPNEVAGRVGSYASVEHGAI